MPDNVHPCLQLQYYTPEDPKSAALRNLGLNELRLPTVDEAVGFITF